jgi:hypothetical protein
VEYLHREMELNDDWSLQVLLVIKSTDESMYGPSPLRVKLAWSAVAANRGACIPF